ncbi:MAG: ribose 5-phosphate isomerase B [Acidobacteria bacterium]|nr:ribose 5-phosphate isomerase B [Acidobacteriota bacterium]
MRVALGADHAGFELKEEAKRWLDEMRIPYEDLGTNSAESVDYPDYTVKVAEGVANGSYQRGILICGSGIGMSMAANKFPGVRAALCFDEEMARLSRSHNDANILILGARFVENSRARRMVEEWFRTEFEGGRHKRRVDKISALEQHLMANPENRK